MSLDNLNDLVYVNLSNTSSQKCPINSAATPCLICQEKCNLSFSNAYFQASCNEFEGGLVYSNLTTTSTSYLTFNENNFNITALYILTQSINTYAKYAIFSELVIESMSDYGYLIIYIPIQVTETTTLTLLPATVPQSFSNINLYDYLPSQRPFYFYNAPYKNSRANYIIFPAQSCNVTMSLEDYKNLWNITNSSTKTLDITNNPLRNPKNDYFQLFESVNPIYYNEIGANISNNNDYYLDCRVADYEEEDTPKDDTPAFNPQVTSSQSMYNSLAFIAIAIVCILLYVLVIHIPNFIN